MDIYGAGVIHKPVLVDLDVKQTKVTGTATFAEGSSLEIVKQTAVADAIKKSAADILVEPTFSTETSGTRITATVTGFPAFYKNFRPITVDDLPLLQVGLTQKATVYEPTAVEQKKKKGQILLVILGFVAITAAIVAPKLI